MALHARVQDHGLDAAGFALRLPTFPKGPNRPEGIDTLAAEMDEWEAPFLLAHCSKPSAIPAVELKFMKRLPRDLDRNVKSALVGEGLIGGPRQVQVMPQLNALDQVCCLERTVFVDQHHSANQCPIRFGWELWMAGFSSRTSWGSLVLTQVNRLVW